VSSDERALRIPPDLADLLPQLSAFFEGSAVSAYATGGFVRDVLLGRAVRDIDVSIDADPLEAAGRLAQTVGGTSFTLDPARRHARVLVPGGDRHVDLLPLRGTIEDDLMHRDFTVGALAVNLADLAQPTVPIIDPTGGLSDLDTSLIRVVSEQAFLDDPLRLLRAVRLAAQLGFEIDPGTTAMIRRHAGTIGGPAPERQRDEIVLIMASSRAGKALRSLDELGLLSVVVPALDVMRGVDQPKQHHWDVFNHSIEAVGALDWLLDDSPGISPREFALKHEIEEQLKWWPRLPTLWHDVLSPGITHLSVVKLAALLHDVGKPETKSLESDGRVRFFGHSEAGAAVARKALKRLRFPAKVVGHISAMIDAHLRPLLIAREGAPSRRSVHRFFRDTRDAGVDTLFLSLADHLATAGPGVTEAGWRRHVAVVAYMLAVASEQPPAERAEPIVGGDDVMAALGIGPGPFVGEVIRAIDEAVAAGQVTTRDEALDVARRYANRNKPGDQVVD
jgi:putative nucleotidyltransferase with HDIG domain